MLLVLMPWSRVSLPSPVTFIPRFEVWWIRWSDDGSVSSHQSPDPAASIFWSSVMIREFNMSLSTSKRNLAGGFPFAARYFSLFVRTCNLFYLYCLFYLSLKEFLRSFRVRSAFFRTLPQSLKTDCYFTELFQLTIYN